MNLFFRIGRMADCTPATWRRYEFALVVWLNFLHVFGRRWDQATARDVEAFKHWRLTDLGNAGRVAPTSFDTDRSALKAFYTWTSARYGTVNPVPAMAGSGSRMAGDASRSHDQARHSRDPLRPVGARRRQVKWMLRPAFEQWRDVGLRGYGCDGLRKLGWRGENEDRDAAFVDGLYGTGLRLSEWASVLDVEIPEQHPSSNPGRPTHSGEGLAFDVKADRVFPTICTPTSNGCARCCVICCLMP